MHVYVVREYLGQFQRRRLMYLLHADRSAMWTITQAVNSVRNAMKTE